MAVLSGQLNNRLNLTTIGIRRCVLSTAGRIYGLSCLPINMKGTNL